MSKSDKQFEAMRNNPRDWRIEVLVSIAVRFGIEVRNHGGSHYVFSSSGLDLAVTVPAHRPIKAVYIRQFVSLVEQVKGKQS